MGWSCELFFYTRGTELGESMLVCLSHCQRLGLREFNISYGESIRFARSEWTSSEHMREIIRVLAGDTYLFGDIFVRR
jgi:hypothetical protein